MTAILLLGSTGQVGWELARSLLPLAPVIALDRQGLDLLDHAAIRHVIAREQPRIIINAAAYTAVDRAELDCASAQRLNVDAPAALAREARRHDALLVHYSTDYVFDGSKAGPYSESDPPTPINHYGQTKLAGEIAIRESGARHLILRTSWVYGLRGTNFLRTVLQLAAERDELTIVDDQIGAPTWCRLIADTTAQILARVSTQPTSFESGVFHLTARGATSWYGFAAAILEQTFAQAGEPGLPPPRLRAIATSDYPTAARRPLNSRLSCARLEQVFGLRLPSWEDCLSLCLQSRQD